MIPRIIHQSWKVKQVPERWQGFQESWRRNHPGYEHRFWTDEDNRDFIARTYPEFVSVYDGYRHPVSRADLARVLVVHHHGGVYADLDCESIRPLDDLLSKHQLVFGLEPASHARKPAVTSRGLQRIVCNAVFASIPRHPFWEHLFPLLMASRDEGNVLEVAGPFVLTRACDTFSRPQDMTILPSEIFYPLDHFLQKADTDAGPGQGPYTIHHWAGTWWRAAVLQNAWRRINEARSAGPDEGC
jgi:mannosyltransferase OCH1-like enzyme